uniref:HNH endonuclease n=1 Tax=Brucella sp. CMUL 015 TaxID=1905697 RepID=UPI001177E244
TVDHIDGNKDNNDISNLEYVTQKENTKRMFDRVGTAHCAEIGKKYSSKKVEWNGTVFSSVSDFCRKTGYKSTRGVKESVKKDWKVKGHHIKYI